MWETENDNKEHGGEKKGKKLNKRGNYFSRKTM